MNEEIVDPIDQLHMMLSWQEEYTDEFKRKCMIEAIAEVARLKGEGR